MTHGRAQRQVVKIGGTRDGRILAYRLDIVQDAGAYPRMGGFLPFLTSLMAAGPYDIAAGGDRLPGGRDEHDADLRVPRRRAAGGDRRDRAGRRPVRRRDRHGPGRSTPDQPGATGQVPLQLPVRRGLRHRARTSRRWTRCWQAPATRSCGPSRRAGASEATCCSSGIGLASYVEITAADAAGGETARLDVHDDGTVTVYTGSSAHGQGHHTAWAMLVEAELGIEMAKVTVIHGDTDLIPLGAAPMRRDRCSSAASPCTRPRSTSRSRPAVSPRPCSRPARPTLSWTPSAGSGRSAATRHPAGPGRRSLSMPGRMAWPQRSITPRGSPPSRSAPISR